MWRRAAALGLFVSVLAGPTVPCAGAPAEFLAGVASATSVDAKPCHGSELPEPRATCPCGCAARPQVAGVPVAVGLAIPS